MISSLNDYKLKPKTKSVCFIIKLMELNPLFWYSFSTNNLKNDGVCRPDTDVIALSACGSVGSNY